MHIEYIKLTNCFSIIDHEKTCDDKLIDDILTYQHRIGREKLVEEYIK